MGTWEFTGREAELAQIVRAFSEGKRAVLLAGRTGIGKSALARAAIGRLEAVGCHAEWVAASRTIASIPFGAVAHLIPAELPHGAGPVAVLRAIADRLGGYPRVVLGVDDANLLDDASASVIAYLIRAEAAFVVLTMRTEDAPDEFVDGLARAGLAQTLQVKRLLPAHVNRLVDGWLAGPVDGLTRRRLHHLAKGNPLVLRELLNSGAMRQRHGLWRWETQTKITGRLAELVHSRLARLKPGTLRVLDLVACGEPMGLSILEYLAGPEAIGRAEESAIITVAQGGMRVEARMAHPLYAEVIREAMPHARRRDAYRRLAAAVSKTGLRRRDDALRVALWQVDGGEVTDAETVRLGVVQAVGRADLVLAERLARAVYAADPAAESGRLLAEVLGYRGKIQEAAALLERISPPTGDGQVQWAITLAETIYWGTGDIAAAQTTVSPVAESNLARASWSWLLFFDGQCQQAMNLADEVLTGPSPPAQAIIWASAGSSAAAGFLGKDPAAIYEPGLNVAKAHAEEMPWGQFEIEIGACLSYIALGDARRSQEIAEAGYHAALDIGVPLMVSGWALFAGMAAMARGNVVTAERLLREAISGFAGNDTFRLARCCTGALAAVAALRGQPHAARDWLGWTDRLDSGCNRVFLPWLTIWRSWALLAEGEHLRAAAELRQASVLARQLGLPTLETEALYCLWRQAASTTSADLDRLQSLASTSAAAAAMAATATGLSQQDGAMLLNAAGAFEQLGQDLLAAEAAAAAAAAFRAQGRQGPGQQATLKAAQLRRQCPDTQTPLLTWAAEDDPLTPREREIAHLALTHSSKEIAAKLGLATTTVNNNIARACAKLGVSGRAGLRSMLG